MEIVPILLTVPALLGVGYAGSSVGILSPPRRQVLDGIAYYVALPALLFTSTARQSLADIFLADIVMGVIIVMLLTMLIAWGVLRNRHVPEVRYVAIVQSYHSNFGYLGIPIVAIAFGDLATARAALILGVGVIVQISFTMMLLSRISGGRPAIHDFTGVIFNPIMLAIIAGFTVAGMGIQIPSGLFSIFAGVGQTALPIALICTGAALTLHASEIDFRLTQTVIGIKVLFMPLLAFLTFLWLGSDAPTMRAAVLMFAMPTAVSTYVFSSAFGGDREVASINIFATTIVATGTMFVVIWVLLAIT